MSLFMVLKQKKINKKVKRETGSRFSTKFVMFTNSVIFWEITNSILFDDF